MYDPSTGRWLIEDPIGFDAGDTDLYRYVGNNPTNAVDPTGLQTMGEGFWYGDHLARTERKRVDSAPVIDDNPNPNIGSYAKVVLIGNFTRQERADTLAAFQHAVWEVKAAYNAISRDWDKVKENFQYIKLGNKRIESSTFKLISDNRGLFEERLEKIAAGVRSKGTVITVEKTNKTHTEGNPMFTVSAKDFLLFGTERADHIGLRTTFWSLPVDGPGYTMTYWTVHEFSRYFLFLDDNEEVEGGHGAQEMDDVINKLAEWDNLLHTDRFQGYSGAGGDF